MPYVDPQSVVAPRKQIRSVEVIYNSAPGHGGWSIARLDWNGDQALGIRWNGDESSAIGNPQSHGLPTWFVVPEETDMAAVENAILLHLGIRRP